MGIIDIFCNGPVTFHNVPLRSVTLRYVLYRLQLAHAVGECILRRGGSDAAVLKLLWAVLVTICNSSCCS